MASYRGEFEFAHPRFPEGSQAAYSSTGPVDISSPDIIYSTEDNEAIDTYIRKNGPYIFLPSTIVLTACQLQLRGILYAGSKSPFSDTDNS
jgi:hypothetical protein